MVANHLCRLYPAIMEDYGNFSPPLKERTWKAEIRERTAGAPHCVIQRHAATLVLHISTCCS